MGSPLMTMPWATTASRASVTSAAGVVGPVTGDVDHPAAAAAFEQSGAEAEDRRNRCAPAEADGGLSRQFLGEGLRRLRPIDEPPGHGDLLGAVAGPFHIGEANFPERAGAHGGGELGTADCRKIAAALQRGFTGIDGARNVNRQNQFEIDACCLRRGPGGREDGENNEAHRDKMKGHANLTGPPVRALSCVIL